MAEVSGVKQPLPLFGLKVAQQSQEAILQAVSAGLENAKQIAKAGAAPKAKGVGGTVDLSA